MNLIAEVLALFDATEKQQGSMGRLGSE